jgi:hypothetical protein
VAPSAPLTVHPSWVQTASTAENAVSFVRDSRNTPAVDSISAAPPTVARADPATVTCTLDAANRPARTGSAEAMPPPGDVGDDDPSPQPENSVTRVTPEAAWQAPAQKRRRETAVVVSDILVGWGGLPGGRGKIEATGKTITGSLNQPLAYLREMKGRPDTISSVRRGM